MSITRSIAVVGTSPGYRVELKMKLSDLKQLIREELSLLEAGEEEIAAPDAGQGLGTQTVSKSKQATLARQKGKDIASGAALDGIDSRERAIMVDLEKIIAAIAEKDDLVKYKAALQTVVDKLRNAAGV